MRRIAAGYCTCTITLFLISILIRYFAQNILIEKLHINNFFTRAMATKSVQENLSPIVINWAELFPFEEKTLAKNDAVPSAPLTITLFNRFKDKITGVEEKIETYSKDWLPFHMKLVESAMRYESVLGWNLPNINIADLGDGYLAEILPKASISNYPNANTISGALYELYNFTEQLNIGFLYIQCPYKISKNDTAIAGTSDFSNENADELLNALLIRDIPYLDLREHIHKVNLDYHSLFYKTDHHWKAETGLWAAGIIGGYLNTGLGYKIDTALFSPEHYRYDIYEDWFLGSFGKKITLASTRPEDITLIYPLFNTDFSLRIPSLGINRSGPFDIFYRYDQISTKDYYNLNPYISYLYGVNDVTAIHNNLLQDDKKILIIMDSFGLTVVPFLSLAVENIELLDLRLFTGSLRTYIKQSLPDLVIVMYNPNQFTMVDYTAHNSTFDFR